MTIIVNDAAMWVVSLPDRTARSEIKILAEKPSHNVPVPARAAEHSAGKDFGLETLAAFLARALRAKVVCRFVTGRRKVRTLLRPESVC